MSVHTPTAFFVGDVDTTYFYLGWYPVCNRRPSHSVCYCYVNFLPIGSVSSVAYCSQILVKCCGLHNHVNHSISNLWTSQFDLISPSRPRLDSPTIVNPEAVAHTSSMTSYITPFLLPWSETPTCLFLLQERLPQQMLQVPPAGQIEYHSPGYPPFKRFWLLSSSLEPVQKMGAKGELQQN